MWVGASACLGHWKTSQVDTGQLGEQQHPLASFFCPHLLQTGLLKPEKQNAGPFQTSQIIFKMYCIQVFPCSLLAGHA